MRYLSCRTVPYSLTLLVLSASSACTGDINPQASDPVVPGVPAPEAATPPSGACAQSIGSAPMRRLTNREFDNTLRALFPGQDLGEPSQPLPGDNFRHHFDNNEAVQGVVLAYAEGYMKAAEGIARAVTQDLPALLGCDPDAQGEQACALTFIERWLPRAYRRPLLADEAQQMLATYDTVRGTQDFNSAIRAVIERTLQSPKFLYRLEQASTPIAGTDLAKLSGFEIASRLSYLLWGSMPDEQLWQAAAGGALSDPAQVRAHAERLLADARAHASLQYFYAQWLNLPGVGGLTRDVELFPEFTQEIAQLMQRETETFVEQLTFDRTLTYDLLFNADFTYANDQLAEYYGLSAPGSSEMVRVATQPGRSAGLLTQGSFLVQTSHPDTTSPIFRGKYVRERLLCDVLPSPPVAVPDLPDFAQAETTRQLYERHKQEPACAGCHVLIDEIGFGFEHFDAAGRWRDTENGQTIDDSGEIVGGGDAAGPFQGATELGQRLGQSSYVRNCVTKQLFRFGYGRDEASQDECLINSLADGLGEHKNVQELLLSLVVSDAFLHRRIEN